MIDYNTHVHIRLLANVPMYSNSTNKFLFLLQIMGTEEFMNKKSNQDILILSSTLPPFPSYSSFLFHLANFISAV